MKRILSTAGFMLLASAANAQTANLTYEQKEQFATLINMNGKLCATVLEVRKSDTSTYYVVCELYRNKLEQGAYYVDLKTGKVK